MSEKLEALRAQVYKAEELAKFMRELYTESEKAEVLETSERFRVECGTERFRVELEHRIRQAQAMALDTTVKGCHLSHHGPVSSVCGHRVRAIYGSPNWRTHEEFNFCFEMPLSMNRILHPEAVEIREDAYCRALNAVLHKIGITMSRQWSGGESTLIEVPVCDEIVEACRGGDGLRGDWKAPEGWHW